LLTGVACGATALCKYTAIVLAPVAVAFFIVAAAYRWRELAQTCSRLAWTRVRVAALAACVVVAYAVLWAGYGFRYSAMHPESDGGRFYHTWEDLHTDSAASRIIAGLREHRLLPEAFLYGAEVTYTYSRSRAAYFLGETRLGG